MAEQGGRTPYAKDTNKQSGTMSIPNDRFCGLCWPTRVRGTFGQVLIHIMKNHKLPCGHHYRMKEAKQKVVMREGTVPS